jgi:hypothetical protein
MLRVCVLAALAAAAGAPATHAEVAPVPHQGLRTPPPPPPRREIVRKALAKQRARHLAALHAYRVKGVFAHDLDRAGEVYVWKDDDGHLDAVAAVMARDGKRFAATVDELAAALIGVHLTELAYGDVYAWVVTSGFAVDEIDRLQRPHTRPTVVRAGDDAWKTDEDARLAKAYASVEAYLRAHADDGLDAATDALMLEPELAWHLVDPAHHAIGVPIHPSIPEPRRSFGRARR